jgi:tRNA-splicing ligase RtcB
MILSPRTIGYQAIENDYGIVVELLANDEVAIQPAAIAQALALLDLPSVAERAQAMVLTPDLHVGTGIPIGVVLDLQRLVVPAIIGRDIGCGMRLVVLEGITEEDITRHRAVIEERLRAIFFAGERLLFTSPRQRTAILREGLIGLLDTIDDNADRGLWQQFDRWQEEAALAACYTTGAFVTSGTYRAFADYITGSGRTAQPDPQLGSLGGGNHFCEIGRVADILEAPTAAAWGLVKDSIVVFIHTGSLSLGSAVGAAFRRPDASARDALTIFDLDDQAAGEYLGAMDNAANFAFVNRLALALMAVRALGQATGLALNTRLVYDAPHNFIEHSDERVRHRKGATPALGATSGRFATGQPILLPGSMGAPSWVLVGSGSAYLDSVSHGAGRLLSRARAARTDDDQLEQLHIVTPIDVMTMRARGRRDLVAEYERRLREEAPGAYKPIEPAVTSIVQAGAARRVARLQPLLTVKG